MKVQEPDSTVVSTEQEVSVVSRWSTLYSLIPQWRCWKVPPVPVIWEFWWKSVVITSHCEDNKFCKSYGNSCACAVLCSWQINTIYSHKILQPTLRAQSNLNVAVKQFWTQPFFPSSLLDCCSVKTWLGRMRSFIGNIWLRREPGGWAWLQVSEVTSVSPVSRSDCHSVRFLTTQNNTIQPDCQPGKLLEVETNWLRYNNQIPAQPHLPLSSPAQLDQHIHL